MKQPTTRPSLLVLERHAESLRNEAKKGNTYFADEEARSIVKGIPDNEIDITPEGKRQSILTGKGLKRDFGIFDYIYNSGYLRTERTMEGNLSAYSEAERTKMQIRMNPFIRERLAGYTYDMTQKEAEAYFPYLKEYFKTFGGFLAQPPGGESLSEFAKGIYLFLNMIFESRANQKVLVVTHGGAIRCFRFLLEHWGYKQAVAWPKGQEPKNCGVTVYRFNGKRLELEDYNRIYY